MFYTSNPRSENRRTWLMFLASTLLVGCIFFSAGIAAATSAKGTLMETFQIADLAKERSESKDPWLEFLRVPDLSMGLYVLAVGEKDEQEPHTEDEVYYVLSGEGMLQVDGTDQPAKAGSLLFVGKNADHRFHSITSELSLLVFFAPEEGTNQPADVR